MKQWVTSDKTLGGEKKISVCLEDEKRKTIGVKNKQIKKTESRMLISQHTSRVRVRLGYGNGRPS
jgi:hypothetical protein